VRPVKGGMGLRGAALRTPSSDLMDLICGKPTQESISLADPCLAALEKRGAVINGKSATELRERLRRARRLRVA
jgi:hypothetical protein